MAKLKGKETIEKRTFSLQARKALIAYSFLLIPVLFYLAIRIIPAFQAFLMSFTTSSSSVFTLENYNKLIHDEVFWKSVKNTMYYAIIIVPLQMLFGLILALAIERMGGKLKWFYRVIFFLPYMTSIVAISWVWRLLYDPNSGVLNEILVKLHLPTQEWLGSPSTALISISLVIIWQMMGFCMLLFTAGLQVIPRQYYEAADIDGANKWQAFWNITFPLLNPTIVFLAIIGVIQTLQTFTQIANLTGGSSGGGLGGPLNSTMSVVVYMYNEGFREYNLHYAAASTVFLFILILIVTLIQFRTFNKSYKL